MTEFIAHRINKIAELKNLPPFFGVELDLRDHAGKIVIAHDPFNYENSDYFDDYLKHYRHKTLILNIKSERIELEILKLIKKHQIKDYFFLDSSFPMIMNLVNRGENNIALRFSEFEGLDTIRNMAGKTKWIWVDCFTKLPINPDIYRELKTMNYKLCLVSPDLLNREADIKIYKEYLARTDIKFDAICTKYKNIDSWKL
jgi:hypothetical protein